MSEMIFIEFADLLRIINNISYSIYEYSMLIL